MIPLHLLEKQCAPQVSTTTLAAIIRVESGGNPLAVWNNTTRSMLSFNNSRQAAAYVRQAMQAGQKVDVGLGQVDTENFRAYGLTPKTAFNVCSNIRVAGMILTRDYQAAKEKYGPGQTALYHAFEAYNSGRLNGDTQYANRILAGAGVRAPIKLTVRQPGPLVYVGTWGGRGTIRKIKSQATVYSVNW